MAASDTPAIIEQAAKLHAGGDAAAAEALLTGAIASRPGEFTLAEAYRHFLEIEGRTREALAVYGRAAANHPTPQFRYRLAELLLAEGRYAEAWPHLEARFEVRGDELEIPRFPFPRWRGEPLAGKSILVFGEMGLGDQIQFARYLEVLRSQGATVAYMTRPALQRLFAPLGVPLLILDQSPPGGPRFDYWVPSLSIPGIVGTTVETIPPPVRLPARPPKGDRSFGLAWAGNSRHPYDRYRSLPRPLADALLALPGARTLQQQQTRAADMASTAALMDQLDLVITVDSAPAHLAGSMGKTCWVLLSGVGTDWRWMYERTDSPWYPSLRLYRQSRPGDWRGVIERVRSDLEAWRAA